MAKRPETTFNTFRFMPGRKEAATDGKVMFHSLRYSRKWSKKDSDKFLAGVAIGPEQFDVGAGDAIALQGGSAIVQALANEKRETIPIREFTPKGEKRARSYIDWATFQTIGDGVRAVPFCEERVVYGEIWTGDFDKNPDAALQLLQAGLFAHGSVPFAGGQTVVNSLSDDRPEDEVGVRATSEAKVLSSRSGAVVGGIPLWIARLFRIQYSEKDSEAILVRQLNNFYLVLVENGNVVIRDLPASYEKVFERRTIEKNLVPAIAA